ncbi:hypothetical protein AcW2_004559 [Taiwanofungus camphoratus]|nr:hypothetical protein AcW2_004559 [Antrodia cinnamomea]
MKQTTCFSRARLFLICCSIVANAICAGGIYTFPLISPALVARMKLTQPQLGTIMLAATVGQYVTAAPVGKLIDRYGPWSCSLLASLMFAAGFSLFASEFAGTPTDMPEPSPSSFRLLVLYYGMLGLGTVLSYFSMLFAATKTFPRCIGLASGTSLAIFGMSPLFFASIASKFFTENDTDLDVTRFFVFLAILTGIVNLFGALVLPGPVEVKPVISSIGDDPSGYHDSDHIDANEQDSLLGTSDNNKLVANTYAIPVQEPDDLSAIGLLKDPYFWILACIVSSTVGAAEMIKSNIGLVVLSLPSSSTSQNISLQVQWIAISDTVTRLVVGALADFISPVATFSTTGVWSFPRKPYTTRILFLACASLLYAATFIWLVIGVYTQESLWPLSVSTGIVNGTIFTMLPSIISAIWGPPNQGRNFGFVSYTCFVGTTAFCYLYAFVAAQHTAPGEGVCHGTQCWYLTFWLSAGTGMVSTCLCTLLRRKWKVRV